MRQFVDFVWGLCACALIALAWFSAVFVIGLFA
jgi:hypothetical protein